MERRKISSEDGGEEERRALRVRWLVVSVNIFRRVNLELSWSNHLEG